MAYVPSAVIIRRLSRLVSAETSPQLAESDLIDALTMYSDGIDTVDIWGAAAECIRWKLAAAVADVSYSIDGGGVQLKQLTENLTALLNQFEDHQMVGTISTAGTR